MCPIVGWTASWASMPVRRRRHTTATGSPVGDPPTSLPRSTDELRSSTQVIILSDTFEQFARPFMRQLDWPTVFCHRLLVDGDRIVDYRLRQPDQKRRSVEAFQALNYRVVAAGDSYNDTTMLNAADAGFLFRAPPNVIAEFPRFRAFDEYDELLAAIRGAL